MSFYHLANGPRWSVIDENTDLGDFQLLKKLTNKDVFFANVGWTETDWHLPGGHHGYLVMVEGPEISWIEREAERIDRPIDVLGMVNYYDYAHPLVRYHPWIEWHYQTQRMVEKFVWQGKSQSLKLVSALAARPTQSKIWAAMALIKLFKEDQILVSLRADVEPKNVHYWQLSGRKELDQLTDKFVDDYLDKKSLEVDDFDFLNQTVDRNHDYNARPYRESIFNINNESWHYSLHQDESKDFIWPGPFLTEKTMKCLLSETALISNGQFDTYRTLEELGFIFDYGLDLSYDQLPGNLDRAQGLLDVVHKISSMSVSQCVDATNDSNLHNRRHIVSGDFYDICEKRNINVINDILEKIV